MRSTARTLIAAAILLASGAASAQSKTVGEVSYKLSLGQGNEFIEMLGYVAGLADAGQGFLICIPRGTTLGYTVGVASRGLSAARGPAEPAAPLLIRAMMAAYPCRAS